MLQKIQEKIVFFDDDIFNQFLTNLKDNLKM